MGLTITSEDVALHHEYLTRSAMPREVLGRSGLPRQRCARCRRMFWFPDEAWDGRYCSARCADPDRAEDLVYAYNLVYQWRERNLCECRSSARRRKIKYSTWAAAVEAMELAQQRAEVPLRVYPCPRGTQTWHLTSKPV